MEIQESMAEEENRYEKQEMQANLIFMYHRNIIYCGDILSSCLEISVFIDKIRIC